MISAGDCFGRHFKKRRAWPIWHTVIGIFSEYYSGWMVDVHSQFLGILKTGDAGAGSVFKIVMTGCLKVARNSIFI